MNHETRLTRQGMQCAGVQLLAAYVLLTAVWTTLGLLLTGPLSGTWITETDEQVATWLVDQRTPAWDDWSHIGSMLAETLVKVIATAIVAAVMLAVWRSWREPFLVVFALVLEASVFITVSWIVGRPRPDVPRLDGSPVSTSFPSGHTAAAAAYGAIAIVVFERTRNVLVRTVTVVVIVAVPIIVGLARMYRGMHYLSDCIAGLLLGIASVLVIYIVVRRCFELRHRGDQQRWSSSPVSTS